MLRGLVEKHGADIVWREGYRALGYPPSLVHAVYEMEAVKAAIEEKIET